jgi:hypothetical protein
LWTPAEITTALWLDAADEDTITLNSGNVSQWDDKSGNDRHATEGTAADQPEYVEDELGGNGIVRFDGASQRLAGSIDSFQETHTVFVVAKFRSHTDFRRAVDMMSGSQEYTLCTGSSTNRWLVSRDTHLESALVYNVNAWGIIGSHFNNAAAGFQRRRLNGASPSTSGFDKVRGTGEDQYFLGNRNDKARAGAVDLAEIIVCTSSLSLEEYEKIEGYLAHRWGLEANLPSGHPYEDAPPVI